MGTVHVINLYIHPLSLSVLPPFFLLSLLSPEFIHIVIHFVIYPPKVKMYGNHYNNSNLNGNVGLKGSRRLSKQQATIWL